MKRSPEKLRLALEITAAESPHWSKLAEHLDIKTTTFWSWFAQSRKDRIAQNWESPFYLEWPEGSPGWWDEMLRIRCREIFKSNLDASVRGMSLPVSQGGGQERFLLDERGMPIPETKPEWLGNDGVTPLPDDVLDLCSVKRIDTFARDAHGKIKYRVLREPVPAHLLIHTTKSVLGGDWSDKRTVHVTGEVTHSAQVMSERPANLQRALPAPQPALPEPEPEIEGETDLGRALRKAKSWPDGLAKRTTIAALMAQIERGGMPENPSPSRPVNTGQPRPQGVPFDTPADKQRWQNFEDRAEKLGTGIGRDQKERAGGVQVAADPPRPKLRDSDVQRPGAIPFRQQVRYPTKMS